MNLLLRTLLLCCLTLTLPAVGLTDIYKYRDANGRLTFVDDKSKVPAQFRDGMTSIPDAEDSQNIYDKGNNAKESPAKNISKSQRADRAANKKLQNHQTPVKISGNRVLVPVEVAMGNRTAKLSLLLDTGATDVVIPEALADQLQLKRGRRGRAMTANGPVTIFSTTISQLTIGDISLHNVNASINPGMRPPSILLGMSALKQVEFVQSGRSLTLKQKGSW